MGSQLIYLATKYTAESEEELEKNYEFACRMASGLRTRGLSVLSPVEMFHPVVTNGLAPKNHEMWMGIDLAIQKRCKMTLFLSEGSTGEDIATSKGVQQEMAIASITHPFLAVAVDSVELLDFVKDFCEALLDA